KAVEQARTVAVSPQSICACRLSGAARYSISSARCCIFASQTGCRAMQLRAGVRTDSDTRKLGAHKCMRYGGGSSRFTQVVQGIDLVTDGGIAGDSPRTCPGAMLS